MARFTISAIVLVGMLLAVSCRSSANDPAFSRVSFSPDGKSIVFAHAENGGCFLYIGDLNTRAAKRLTKTRSGCENNPSFSSNGKLIVYSFAPDSDRKSSLFIVSADGSDSRRITPSGSDDIYPIFSADNRVVYFVRSGSFGHSSPIAASRQHDFDLFSVDLTSGAVAQLTQQSLYDLQSLSISPDGKDLMISTTRYPIGALIEIYVIAKPQSARKVFQPHVPDEPKLTAEPEPAFGDACYMPDGLGMLVLAASNKAGGNYDYNVYLVNTVTGSIDRKLTNLTGMTTGVQVSPDGKTAVLGNQGKLYLLNLQNRELKPLDWSGLGH